MHRRTFLRGLLAAMGGAVLDPERLLWVPGAKTIVLPPVTGWQGHTFVTADWIAHEALQVLKKNLAFARTINLEYATRTGMTLHVRTPARWAR